MRTALTPIDRAASSISVTNASSDAASSSSNIHAGRTSGDDVLLRREGLISITSQPPRLVP